MPQVPELLEAYLQFLQVNEISGEETPRSVQGFLAAMSSAGGMVRSQGRMPTQMAFETPSSWNPQTPRLQGAQMLRMDEEELNFNLFDADGDLAQQSSCAGIPQVDLLGPLGGEGHRGKGQGGNDQKARHGDVLRSQGPLRQDHGEREGNAAGHRERSLDLLGDVLRGSHGDDATLQRGRGQRINQRSLQNLQRGGNRQGNDRDDCGLSADHQRKDRSRSRGEDRFQGQGQDHQLGKENHAETKKVQPKDREGQTLEQELSSLLVQELMHENEELRKRLDAMSQSQQAPRAQPVQKVVDPKQNLANSGGSSNLLMAAVQEDFVANSMWIVSLQASL